MRLHASEPHGRRDELAVDRGVDLHEVVGSNCELEPEILEPIAQGAGYAERGYRARAAGLQVNIDTVTRSECRERIAIGRGRRLEHAEHQRDGVVRDGRLDLRQLLPNTRGGDQLRELARAMRRAAPSDGAMRHVGDVRRRALAKADQHAFLTGHVLHAETGTAAIAPRLAHRPAATRPASLPRCARALSRRLLA